MKKILIFLIAMFVGTAGAATETMEWYVDNVLYDTTTCQSGNDVILPTTPTKAGYTFIGWDDATYDFSTLDYTIDGTSYTDGGRNMTWSVTFPYGTISGISLCSSTQLPDVAIGTPDESGTGDTQYCWCKATGYIPTDSNLKYEPEPSVWVYRTYLSTPDYCNVACASNCSRYGILNVSGVRRVMFGAQ